MLEHAEESFLSLEPWLEACEARGLAAAVVREIDEVRAVCDGRGVTVGPMQRLTLLAYHKGTLLRAEVDGNTRAIVTRLEGMGWRVRSVKDHIG